MGQVEIVQGRIALDWRLPLCNKGKL